MLKTDRLPIPKLLDEHNKKGFMRKWQSSGVIYDTIKSTLMLMTQEHCSFCDSCHTASIGDAVEHFKPKSNSLYSHLTYEWTNLFYICTKCNTYKGSKFDDKLLKPDEIEYEFNKYFVYKSINGELESRKDISEHDKERVEITISLYNLNRDSLKKSRKILTNEIQHLLQLGGIYSIERDEKSFRFIIEMLLP